MYWAEDNLMATARSIDFEAFLNAEFAAENSDFEFDDFDLWVDRPTENLENFIDSDNWVAGDGEPPSLDCKNSWLNTSN